MTRLRSASCGAAGRGPAFALQAAALQADDGCQKTGVRKSAFALRASAYVKTTARQVGAAVRCQNSGVE
jgi:hypothetical protein